MRRSAVWFLVLGCVDSTVEPSLDALPPPPELRLSTSGLPIGGTADLQAEGANPGETVFFGGSIAGPGAGPCPPVLGGSCLGIRSPLLLGTATADPSGVATLSLSIPAGLSEVWVQSAVARGGASLVSNLVSSDVRAPGAGDLVITEIMRNPDAVADTEGEWFEVYNPNDWAVDLAGVEVRDFGVDRVTLTSGVVPPRSWIVLGSNDDAATNGDVHVDVTWSGNFSLGNGDDEIELARGSVVIDTVAWTSAWPSRAGSSMSLEPTATDNSGGGSWCDGVNLYGSGDFGSPGADNPSCGTVVPGGCTSVRDQDGDGFLECEDCDDFDVRTYPGAPERCDGIDNDCDGALPVWDQDLDGDALPECDLCGLSGYGGPIAAASGSVAIRNAIRGLAQQQSCTDYNAAREWMFVVLDKDANSVVEGVYTGRTVSVGSVLPPNNQFNTEHTWPQGQGTSSNPARCDLHHLFPTWSQANSQRGSLPFGEVSSVDWSSGGSSRGDSGGSQVFEPRTSHKGDVARAMLYVSIRHNLPLSTSQENLFKSWHALDPVDARELRRTLLIEEEQGVANPFVVCPDVVPSL